MAELNDTFTGSSGVLTGHTADSGESWTNLTDTNEKNITLDGSGHVYCNATGGSVGICFSSWTPPTADYTVKVAANVASASGDLGVVARLTGSTWSNGSYYMARYETGTGYQIFKNVNGSYTQKGSTDSGTSAPANGDTIELEVSGTSTTTLRLLKNGVQLISTTDSSSPLTSAGKAGLWMAGSQSSSTGYQATSIVTVSASATLVANVAAVVSISTGACTISGTAATGGVDTKSYQLKRGTDGVTFGTNVGSAQVLSGSTAPSNQADSGLTDGTLYYYRWSVTDSAGSPATVNSNILKVVPHAAGTAFCVSSAGNDSNAGTSGSPWLTITKANNYLAASILAGDSLSFNGGDTFSGSVHAANAPGTAGAPFIIGKYGSGAPVIDCDDSYGVWLEDCSHTRVRDLTITGSGVNSSGVTTSVDAGVKATLAGSANLSGLRIERCTITGCFYGVLLEVDTGNSRSFVKPVICGNSISECGFLGIGTWQVPNGSAHTTRITSPYIGLNTVYNIYGTSNTAETNQGDWPSNTQSGFGMYLGNLSGGLIEANLVHDTGEASSSSSAGGPVGIMTYECNGTTIRLNEVYNSFSPDGNDGQGIDLDGGSVSCIVERNWIHDCDGPAFMDLKLTGFTQNDLNVFRWNISENNGRRSTGSSSGNNATLITINNCTNPLIYNNTDYAAFASGAENKTIDDRSTSGAIFRNNIFTVSGSGETFGSVQSGTLLQGNCYNAVNGASFSLTYNSVAKTSLGALQGVAETVNSVAVGTTTDPGFTNAGNGNTCAVGTIYYNLSDYDSSALITAGLDLLTLFGTDAGGVDFHGNYVRTTDGFPIGAVAAEFPVSAAGGGGLLIGGGMSGGFQRS